MQQQRIFNPSKDYTNPEWQGRLIKPVGSCPNIEGSSLAPKTITFDKVDLILASLSTLKERNTLLSQETLVPFALWFNYENQNWTPEIGRADYTLLRAQ